MATGYSYVRFSSAKQANGDSLRRQAEKTADWCRRHKVTLDTSLTLRDLGVSAFKGKHRSSDQYALGQFLQCVKTGRVPAGSFLIIESLDRLSREEIVPGVNLFTGILLAGVKVVQLIPAETVYTAAADMSAIMLAIVELSRGHSESKVKSERVSAAWAAKRKTAATKVLTRRLPGWLALDNGKLFPIPEKVEVMRELFRRALAGQGMHAIAKALNAAKVPVLGRTTFKGKKVVWAETAVYHLLCSRATIGEFQAYQGRGAARRAVGDAVADYFPRIVSDETFYRVQSLLRARATCGRGRRGKHFGMFSGLLTDARDGGSLTYKHVSGKLSVLIPVNAKHGSGTPWASFPAKPLEDAILSRLREVKASDVFPDKDGGGGTVEAAAAKLAGIEALIATWRKKMDVIELADTITAKLLELEGRRKTLAAELAEARQQAAAPATESWGEFRSLADLLADDESDELRERVRAALRRAVDGIWLLILKGRPRVCAAQVWFKGERGQPARHRDYLVVYHQGQHNGTTVRPGRWQVSSFTEVAMPGDLDLRKPAHADRLLRVLESADPSAWGD
jgi:DNA invertase Pin-like site-specific DNA recombinase